MLPDSIPESLWAEFRLMRKKIKHPMTEYAEELILAKLERWRLENGADPKAILEESIERGWSGVFLNGHGKPVATKPAQISLNACKKCGSTDWTSLDRYRSCERCR